MDKHCWMIVTEKGNPILIDYRLPIYWRKGLAQEDALNRAGGARVVRIDMPKENPATGG